MSIAAGSVLRDHAGGSEPLMAIFPMVMLVAVRWGIGAALMTLALGIVGAWYVYIGQPFSFEISSSQMPSLVLAAVIGGLILTMCAALTGAIADLRAANAASSTLTSLLTARSAELLRLNDELERALHEQARSREAIDFSKTQFRISFEYAAVGKVQAEPESGKIIRANQAFCTMLGYTPEELVGKDGWALTFADDVAADRAAYRQVLDGKVPRYVREKRYVKSDGTLVWARVSLAIVRSPHDGSPQMTIAVVENIEDQHRYRIALEHGKAELERMLTERTEALRQRDLLLREVYHRVKNNLQVVDSLIMLQVRLIDDAGARSQLQQTRDRIFALGLVHHQLMGSDDLRTFDVAPFLTQLVDNLTAGSPSRQVAITVDAGPIKVDLDFAIPLGLVVTELVTNALKHAFHGRPGHIAIGLEEDAAGIITLRLSDDGPGMPPTDEQAGLGMRIVAGLLDQMRGHLHRDSLSGTGYRIVFQPRDVHELAQ